MNLERFELDFMPHSIDEEHGPILRELISNTIRDYHAAHPKLRKKDVQNAVRNVETDFLNASTESNELPPEAPRDSDCSRRFMSMTGMLILLSSIAMIAAMVLIRRP